ncbi:MAG: chorismate mutase [Candidatus Gracilibacteria bacterium]|jgi:chorismate mutase
MNKLQNYRLRIDKIDSKIISLIRKREKIIGKIGLIKAKDKIQIHDKKREKYIFSGLNTDFEREVFKTILNESKKMQRRDLTER